MKKTRFPLLVLACGLLTAASCSDPPPRPNGTSSSAWPAGDNLLGPILGGLGLLRCAPLPADSVTQLVGPAGGVIEVGPHSLTIPPAALSGDVAITAVLPSDTVNVVRFAPHGLVFGRKVTLTMSYANCNLLGQLLPRRIVYTSDELIILDDLKSHDDLLAHTVWAKLDHFSGYAVAW